MSYTLKVQSEAIVDIQEAFEWYETQQKGLGYQFIEEIESSLIKIGDNPLHFTAINQQYRRLKVNRFSYLIVYEIEGSNVVVNSIRHTSRKPKF